MTVKDIMSRHVVCIPTDMSVSELATTLTRKRISGAPVVDADGKIVGVVSLTDIASYAAKAHGSISWWKTEFADEELIQGFQLEDHSGEATVEDIMTAAVYQVPPETTVKELVATMLSAQVHRLVVTRAGEIEGIVTTTNVMKAFLEHLDGAAVVA